MRGNFITDRAGDKNPNYKHGGKGTRLFSIWANMKSRCYNQNTTYYSRYGGRGITVCDEWKDNFQAFYDWAMANGYSEDLTIDRKDNDKGYSPDNCRWVTVNEQSTNRSTNHVVTINGISKCLMDWCVDCGISYKTVKDRLKRGWTYEDALFKVVQTKFRRKVH